MSPCRFGSHVHAAALCTLACTAIAPSSALASSHREAPLITEDATVDATDVFAFRHGNNVVLIVDYIPFESPQGGPNFFKYSDNAVYRINIDNTGDAVADMHYDFTFRTTIVDTTTFLYNLPPTASGYGSNVAQTMTVTRTVGSGAATVIATGPVAPAYVGRHSFLPSGLNLPDTTTQAAADAAYDSYVQTHDVLSIATGPDAGGQVFAGPRDDPFFVDLGAVFDLLRIRPITANTGSFGQLGGGIDGLAGYNVHSIVLEVPIAAVSASGGIPSDASLASSQIGVWTTAYRPRVHVFHDNAPPDFHGQLVQVSRLGLPLVNELLMPIAFKDFFNRSQPASDIANYGTALSNNLVTGYLNALYVPPGTHIDPAGVFTVLATVVLNGGNAAITASDMLHLNLAVAANAFPAQGSTATLGILGADTAGFPNGRRLADDVTDIELRVLAGAPSQSTFLSGVIGDGVNLNDRAFAATFPYVGRPWEGFASQPPQPVQPSATAR